MARNLGLMLRREYRARKRFRYHLYRIIGILKKEFILEKMGRG